jgi:NitT/TauT family transport system substrate-binding protein
MVVPNMKRGVDFCHGGSMGHCRKIITARSFGLSWRSQSRMIIAMALIFLLGPNGLRGANAQETVSIGIAGENFSFLPFRIAQERGFYRKHKLNVQHVRIPGANVAISALLSGNLDYGTHYQVTMLWGAKGLGTRAIFSTASRQLFSFVVQPTIHSVHDLKGKMLGIPSIGSLGHKITLRVLRKLGIDPEKDVRMLAVGGDANRSQQLRAKQIDATMVNPPLSIMLRKEGFNLLLQAGDYVDVPLTGVGTTVKKIRENPEQVKNLLRALFEGLRYVRTNRKDTIDIFSTWLGIDASIAAETYDLAVKMLSTDGLMSDESVMAAMEIFSDNPKELENYSVANAVDFSLLRSVAKEYAK